MHLVTDKTYPPFKEYIFNYFVEWEKLQPKKRSSYSAFARWLSKNSYQTIIKQQTVSEWINGKYKPDDEQFLLVLAEKIGDEIYDVLNKKRPNPFLLAITTRWDRISEERQRKLAEDAARYEVEDHEQHIQESSKRRKKRKAD
jgi:hypothetical protein